MSPFFGRNCWIEIVRCHSYSANIFQALLMLSVGTISLMKMNIHHLLVLAKMKNDACKYWNKLEHCFCPIKHFEETAWSENETVCYLLRDATTYIIHPQKDILKNMIIIQIHSDNCENLHVFFTHASEKPHIFDSTDKAKFEEKNTFFFSSWNSIQWQYNLDICSV